MLVGAAALPFINRLPLQASERSDAIGSSGLSAGQASVLGNTPRPTVSMPEPRYVRLDCLSPLLSLMLPPGRLPPAERRFVLALASLAILALFLVSATTVNALWPLAPSTRHLVMAGACALLLPLLALPCGAGGLLSRRPLAAHQQASPRAGQADAPGNDAAPNSSSASSSMASFGSLKDKADLEEPLLERPGEQLVEAAISGQALEAHMFEAPAAAAAPPELAPLQCLCSLDFWLLFAVIAVGTGSGAPCRCMGAQHRAACIG